MEKKAHVMYASTYIGWLGGSIYQTRCIFSFSNYV